jgi:ATP-dependent Clp protease ATP-binding subunit ClpC
MRLMLGVLDKSILNLGDNTKVLFDNCLIFFTSNLGADGIRNELLPTFGLPKPIVGLDAKYKKIESIGIASAKKYFSAEFMNRIDATIVYKPLTSDNLKYILDLELEALQDNLDARLLPQEKRVNLFFSAASKEWLLEKGTSIEYGARELKRLLRRSVIQPLAIMLTKDEITHNQNITIDVSDGNLRLR